MCLGYMQAVIVLCFVQRVAMQNKERQGELVVIIRADVHARFTWTCFGVVLLSRHCHQNVRRLSQIISDPAFLEGVTARGERLRAGLRAALAGNPHVKEVRGLGLICGVQLDVVRTASFPT